MKYYLFSLCIFLTALSSVAQTLSLDLSKNKNSTFSQTIEPQLLKQIVLINRAELSTYVIEVKKEKIQVPPIDITALLGGDADDCGPLEEATRKLTNEPDESKIPNRITAIKNELTKLNGASGCAESIAKAYDAIEAITLPIKISVPINIGSGDKVTVTVTKGTAVWTYVFFTETVPHGRIFYGFSYLLSNALSSFPTYYAKAGDAANSFIITRSNAANKKVFKNLTPTIMYTHMFFKDPGASLKFGLTGGFMADLSNPSLVASPSLVIGDAIALNFGIGVAQKDQLQGQYVEGLLIKDNLAFDQLHQKIWTYDLFFGISFHFNSNPFKKDTKKAAESGTD